MQAMDAELAQPLTDHRDAIARLCEQHGVIRLEVFGSAAVGRFDPARSDFDFIAQFAPEVQDTIASQFFALTHELEELLGRHVDLMTDQPIGNPYFRQAVNASRREIYVRSPAQTPA
jgi:predicted nucleotidyltransferase